MNVIKRYTIDEEYTGFAVSPAKDIYILIGGLILPVFMWAILFLPVFILSILPVESFLEGKLYSYLPKDTVIMSDEEVRITLRYNPNKPPLLTNIKIGQREIPDWAMLFKEILAISQQIRATNSKPIPFKIDAESNIPFQAVINAFNACKKAGAEIIEWADEPTDIIDTIPITNLPVPPLDVTTDFPAPKSKPTIRSGSNTYLIDLLVLVIITIMTLLIMLIFRIRPNKLSPQDIISQLKELLKDNRHQDALVLCRDRPSAFSRIISRFIVGMNHPREHLDEMVELSIRQEAVKLCGRLNMLLLSGIVLLSVVFCGMAKNLHDMFNAIKTMTYLTLYDYIGIVNESSPVLLVGLVGMIIITIAYYFSCHQLNLAMVKLRARVYELIRVIKP